MPERRRDKVNMSKIKILHAADLHLDSPFEGLPAGKAAIRRGEQRALLARIAELARREGVQLVLLAGDLLDSENTYYETGEELCRSLSQIAAPVFISPGNHDFYSPKSVYARLKLPENVHVFTSGDIEAVTLPELGARVFGAAFTDKRSGAMLRDECHIRYGDVFDAGIADRKPPHRQGLCRLRRIHRQRLCHGCGPGSGGGTERRGCGEDNGRDMHFDRL